MTAQPMCWNDDAWGRTGPRWDGKRAHLVVRVGRRRFAFPAETIQHLLPELQFLPVPFGPRWLDGLALGQGELIPALNLGILLDCPPAADHHLEAAPALLVEPGAGQQRLPMAFAVDRLLETALIGWNEVHRLRSNNPYFGNPAVLGIWRGYVRTCYVLDAGALLTDHDWCALQESLPMLATTT